MSLAAALGDTFVDLAGPRAPASASSPATSSMPGAPASPGRLFADSLRLPLQTPLLQLAPPARAPVVYDWVPRRSVRLAAKSAFRDPQPERQAKRVLLNKWSSRLEGVHSDTPDDMITAKFHDTFSEPMSSSKRAAMQELFPAKVGRGPRAAARLF